MRLDARRVDAAITRFDILRYDRGGASQPAVHIVAGILHTVCGDHALRILMCLVVRLIAGDGDLATTEARQVLRRTTDEDTRGEVYPALAEG